MRLIPEAHSTRGFLKFWITDKYDFLSNLIMHRGIILNVTLSF